ncbi:MAG: response regulator [Sedimentisphaerales bacterium]|nr:response regulator [Sedimentisphaerales bacterium]
MDQLTTILVIEDEERIRNILKYNLELDGFEVYLAEDGITGLEIARENPPDLILLDWMMPGLDGLQVLSELRHDDRTKDIPVFMLTAKSMMAEIGRALYEGADDYITKPFDVVELGQILKEKLERAKA